MAHWVTPQSNPPALAAIKVQGRGAEAAVMSTEAGRGRALPRVLEKYRKPLANQRSRPSAFPISASDGIRAMRGQILGGRRCGTVTPVGEIS